MEKLTSNINKDAAKLEEKVAYRFISGGIYSF